MFAEEDYNLDEEKIHKLEEEDSEEFTEAEKTIEAVDWIITGYAYNLSKDSWDWDCFEKATLRLGNVFRERFVAQDILSQERNRSRYRRNGTYRFDLPRYFDKFLGKSKRYVYKDFFEKKKKLLNLKGFYLLNYFNKKEIMENDFLFEMLSDWERTSESYYFSLTTENFFEDYSIYKIKILNKKDLFRTSINKTSLFGLSSLILIFPYLIYGDIVDDFHIRDLSWESSDSLKGDSSEKGFVSQLENHVLEAREVSPKGLLMIKAPLKSLMLEAHYPPCRYFPKSMKGFVSGALASDSTKVLYNNLFESQIPGLIGENPKVFFDLIPTGINSAAFSFRAIRYNLRSLEMKMYFLKFFSLEAFVFCGLIGAEPSSVLYLHRYIFDNFFEEEAISFFQKKKLWLIKEGFPFLSYNAMQPWSSFFIERAFFFFELTRVNLKESIGNLKSNWVRTDRFYFHSLAEGWQYPNKLSNTRWDSNKIRMKSRPYRWVKESTLYELDMFTNMTKSPGDFFYFILNKKFFDSNVTPFLGDRSIFSVKSGFSFQLYQKLFHARFLIKDDSYYNRFLFTSLQKYFVFYAEDISVVEVVCCLDRLRQKVHFSWENEHFASQAVMPISFSKFYFSRFFGLGDFSFSREPALLQQKYLFNFFGRDFLTNSLDYKLRNILQFAQGKNERWSFLSEFWGSNRFFLNTFYKVGLTESHFNFFSVFNFPFVESFVDFQQKIHRYALSAEYAKGEEDDEVTGSLFDWGRTYYGFNNYKLNYDLLGKKLDGFRSRVDHNKNFDGNPSIFLFETDNFWKKEGISKVWGCVLDPTLTYRKIQFQSRVVAVTLPELYEKGSYDASKLYTGIVDEDIEETFNQSFISHLRSVVPPSQHERLDMLLYCEDDHDLIETFIVKWEDDDEESRLFEMIDTVVGFNPYDDLFYTRKSPESNVLWPRKKRLEFRSKVNGRFIKAERAYEAACARILDKSKTPIVKVGFEMKLIPDGWVSEESYLDKYLQTHGPNGVDWRTLFGIKKK